MNARVSIFDTRFTLLFAMVLAVLEAHCGVRLSGHDVYLNVAGGLRINEPAADLAAAAALVSSLAGAALHVVDERNLIDHRLRIGHAHDRRDATCRGREAGRRSYSNAGSRRGRDRVGARRRAQRRPRRSYGKPRRISRLTV